MMEWLKGFDQYVLKLINHDLSSPFLDQALPVFSTIHHMPWFEFAVAPFLLLVWFYIERKNAMRVLFAVLVTVSLSDTFAYRFVKTGFFRERPHIAQPNDVTMRLSYGPKSGSFPSNHTTNGFAIATVLSWYYPALRIPLYALAAAVGFSRVYAGVHYPTDVIGGAIIGYLLGLFFIWSLFKRFAIFRRRR